MESVIKAKPPIFPAAVSLSLSARAHLIIPSDNAFSGISRTFHSASQQQRVVFVQLTPTPTPRLLKLSSYYFLGMNMLVFLLLVLFSAGTYDQVSGTEQFIGNFGETIAIPCNKGAPPPQDVIFVKWKYEKNDGTSGDLLIKQVRSDQTTVQATDDYASRVSIGDKYSLLISQVTLKDQKTFTCMVVSGTNLMEYPVSVVIYKKPSSFTIMDKNDVLHKDKPTTVGTCVALNANPPATITWTKDGQPLRVDGKVVVIANSTKLDTETLLSTTYSTLQYVATKEDANSAFACLSSHVQDNQAINLDPFPIYYPSEKVSLEIISKGSILEGDNVTLKCHADGNPPPKSFFFYLKGQKRLVENSDNYTLTNISREAAGEYKCSLTDNEKMEASQSISVIYLDLNLKPSGKVERKLGETLSVSADMNSSGEPKVLWTKNGKAVNQPEFSKLTFADSGVYLCEASLHGIVKRQSFELRIEGKPVIKRLIKHQAADGGHKVLSCEAEGIPEPSFQWSVNHTDEKTLYNNGTVTHKIIVVPTENLTVSCTVKNNFGEDVRTINVSSVFKEESEGKESHGDSQDQSKLIVAVVGALLFVAAAVGLIYWLYMKKRRGSWKTGEKEMGTSEESKKLEENNHPV